MERALKGTGIKVPAEKKLRVGIIGGGLGAMITAMELSDAGHDVQIFESRRFHGGKVGSSLSLSLSLTLIILNLNSISL
jgi:monoamine oxidase